MRMMGAFNLRFFGALDNLDGLLKLLDVLFCFLPSLHSIHVVLLVAMNVGHK